MKHVTLTVQVEHERGNETKRSFRVPLPKDDIGIEHIASEVAALARSTVRPYVLVAQAQRRSRQQKW